MEANIHLRKVDKSMLLQLKSEAKRCDISVNTLILQILRRSLGMEYHQTPKKYQDLNKFAGTWNTKDWKEFTKNISDFEQIDEDLWQ